MQKLIDKAVVVAISFALAIIVNDFIFILIPFLSVSILSLLNSLFEEKKYVKYISFSLFFSVCFFYIRFIIFLPVLFYDFDYSKKSSGYCLLSLIPLFIYFDNILICAFIITATVSIFLNSKTFQIFFNKTKYFNFKDRAKETELQQKKTYDELKDSQDEKINIIKIEERNLIAAEIHDNVGHLLSSSILLTGAILSTSKEEQTKKSLLVLQNSLKTAMGSIRESVHNIHKDVYNLEAEIVKIVNDFTFCDIELSYNIISFLENYKCRHIISIIKECLTNVIKHSNATKVMVTLNEHPAIYQLVVSDNGTVKKPIGPHLGLKSINDRVEKLSGILNISIENGFRVFISFKKELS